MKRVNFFSKKKITFLLLLFGGILYISYVKFFIPLPFFSYENYHSIEAVNSWYCILGCGLDNLWSYFTTFVSGHLFSDQSDGYISGLMYPLLLSKLTFGGPYFVFYFQSLLSIISCFFFSSSFFLVNGKKKILTGLFFLLLLTSPHQIKYGMSEEYYIIGNFFLSISLFLFLLFVKTKNIFLYVFCLVAFIFALYSRTLYVLYIPIFILIYFFQKQVSGSYTYLKVIGVSFFSFLFCFPLYERIFTLVSQDKRFDSSGQDLSIYFKKVIVLLGDMGTSYAGICLFFMLLGFIGIFWFYTIKKKYFKMIGIGLLFSYILFVSYKYSHMMVQIEALNRHVLLLEPLYFIFISLGLYFLFLFLKKILPSFFSKGILLSIILLLLLQPFIFWSYIRANYSVHKEVLFIHQVVNSLGKSYNLIIPTRGIYHVDYEFPFFLIKNPDLWVYYIQTPVKNKYASFVDSYEEIKQRKSFFYLSTACYSSGDNSNSFLLKNGIREDCKYMMDHFTLKPVAEYSMPPETYIIPKLNTPLPIITIGFYEIVGKR